MSHALNHICCGFELVLTSNFLLLIVVTVHVYFVDKLFILKSLITVFDFSNSLVSLLKGKRLS